MQRTPRVGFTLIEVIIVVAIVATLTTIAVPAFMRASNTARGRACQENLTQIDAAVNQWALENRRPLSAAVTLGELIGNESYIRRRPVCPTGGDYSEALAYGAPPTCTVGEADEFVPHVLPEADDSAES